MNWITPILLINLALTMDPVEVVVAPYGWAYETGLPEQIVSMETTVGVLLFETIGIEGDAFVYTEPPWLDDSSFFAPFQSDFYFRAYLTRWGVELGWEHLCTHPTLTAGTMFMQRYGGKDTFYLSYELGAGK